MPQTLLLAYLIARLTTFAGDAAERRYLMLLVVPGFVIVPIAVVISLLCLLSPDARAFGKALLASTLISSIAFVLICMATTSA